jgi:hypothetical protein
MLLPCALHYPFLTPLPEQSMQDEKSSDYTWIIDAVFVCDVDAGTVWFVSEPSPYVCQPLHHHHWQLFLRNLQQD